MLNDSYFFLEPREVEVHERKARTKRKKTRFQKSSKLIENLQKQSQEWEEWKASSEDRHSKGREKAKNTPSRISQKRGFLMESLLLVEELKRFS